jgi:glycosyltransferase involved in cell wall biosynthesis
MSLRVSVVIPSYKRPDLLARCLDAVMSQDVDPGSYEVIVVDDGGSLDTRRVVESWGPGSGAGSDMAPESGEMWTNPSQLAEMLDGTAVQTLEQVEELTIDLPGQPSLRYLVPTGKHGPAAARNYGWKAAQGSIIAFTDDDCIPWPNWLDVGTKAMGDKFAGISGQVLVPISNNPTDYELDVSRHENYEFGASNCFYTKQLLTNIGGFDERFVTAWREDSDLYFTLLENNFPLGHAPTAIVLHPVRKEAPGISLSRQKKQMFNALLYKKHRQLYLTTVQKKPPVHYYAMLLSLFGALVGLAFANPLLASIFLGIWFALLVGLCYQRLKPTSKSALHIFEIVITSIFIPYLAIYWRLYGAYKFRVFFL